MYLLHTIMGLGAIVYLAHSACADSPSEIYQKRVIPLIQSSKASSCSECHLQGVHLEDFLTPDPKASFASLRVRGWIDVDHPDQSKLLQFIAKKPDQNDELMDQVRSAELKAIGDWIRASARDPSSLDTPLPKLNDLKLDDALMRHARKDRVLIRFVDAVWSQLERCANCHSPDRNAKHVEKNGKQMSWIVPNSPAETLQLLEDRDLINISKPSASLLRTKALGRDEHGGGIKFPEDGQTDRQWLGFLEDYASLKRQSYVRSTDVPDYSEMRTWRTGFHLKIKDLPKLPAGTYAVVAVYAKKTHDDVEADAVAIGEGKVSLDGTSWSSTLMLLEPSHLRHTDKPVPWSELLPDGKYQLRWIVPEKASHSIEKILSTEATCSLDIDSLWKPGHSSAKSISWESFHTIKARP